VTFMPYRIYVFPVNIISSVSITICCFISVLLSSSYLFLFLNAVTQYEIWPEKVQKKPLSKFYCLRNRKNQTQKARANTGRRSFILSCAADVDAGSGSDVSVSVHSLMIFGNSNFVQENVRENRSR